MVGGHGAPAVGQRGRKRAQPAAGIRGSRVEQHTGPREPGHSGGALQLTGVAACLSAGIVARALSIRGCAAGRRRQGMFCRRRGGAPGAMLYRLQETEIAGPAIRRPPKHLQRDGSFHRLASIRTEARRDPAGHNGGGLGGETPGLSSRLPCRPANAGARALLRGQQTSAWRQAGKQSQGRRCLLSRCCLQSLPSLVSIEQVQVNLGHVGEALRRHKLRQGRHRAAPGSPPCSTQSPAASRPGAGQGRRGSRPGIDGTRRERQRRAAAALPCWAAGGPP